MPTDGQDFPKRKKCYGAAYTAAKQGASPADVAPIACAGMARDLRGAPVEWLRSGIDLVSKNSQDLVGLSSSELSARLKEYAGDLSNQNSVICLFSLSRIAGRLSHEGAQATPKQVAELLGHELFKGLVIEKELPEYLRYHQGRAVSEDSQIAEEIFNAAKPHISDVMKSAYESKKGRPDKSLETPHSTLPEIDSSSLDSLTSTPLAP